MRNAIVTASDANYLPAACCALLSCINDGAAKARLFILACDISPDDAEQARAFLRTRGASVDIITIPRDAFRQFRIDGYVSASTYSRLLLPDFFDDQWDRLLYVDADMRVLAPMQTLFDTDLGGRPVAAVHDYMQYLIYGAQGSRARLGLQHDSAYFNAGIMCFDWRATIASGLLQQARDFALQHSDLCKAHDQDALNKAFEGAWLPLDPRWNFMVVALPEKVLRLDYPSRYRPYVAHFAGPTKPWTARFPAKYREHRAWYWDLLRDSPWPNFASPPDDLSDTADAPSFAGHLAEWASTQHGKFRAAYRRLSNSEIVITSSLRVTAKRGAAASKAPGHKQSNPELELLFDEMVDEAGRAGTGPRKRAIGQHALTGSA